jgi:hypothetical protein
VSLDERARRVRDLFSRFGRRPVDDDATDAAAAAVDSRDVFRTKALEKFLAALGPRQSPVLLDVGRAVGPNVTFFGAQLGCTMYVEDLYSDLNRHAAQGQLGRFPGFLEKRFKQSEASVDGILGWDLFDYLEPPAAQVLARELKRLMRPDGLLFALFGTSKPTESGHVKYVIVDQTHLLQRRYPASSSRHRVLLSREIVQLFDGLVVSDSFLLQAGLREMLFCKPARPRPTSTAG